MFNGGEKDMQEIRKDGSAWATNSHAENTEEQGLRLLVDWVTCSFHFASSLADLLHVIGLHDAPFEKMNFARYDGYHHTYRLDKMEILATESEDKFMLNFSGQACRIYEQTSAVEWTSLFALLLDNFQATFTRLDIAIDDFEEIYKTSTVRQAVHKKLCVTRLAKWGDRTEGLIAKGKEVLTMDSFYLGGKTSRYILNIYDKKVEREEHDLTVTVSSWTRTELRLKNEYATRFAGVVASGKESLGYYTMSFLNEKIQFLKPGVYKNKSRAAADKKNVSRWWLKFIGSVGKLNLSQQAPDKTIATTMQWMRHQVAPSTAMIYEAEGEDAAFGFFMKLIKDGQKRLSKKQEMMIDDHKFRVEADKKRAKEEYDRIYEENNKRLNELKKGTKQEKAKYKSKVMDKYFETNLERDPNPDNKKSAGCEPAPNLDL